MALRHHRVSKEFSPEQDVAVDGITSADDFARAASSYAGDQTLHGQQPMIAKKLLPPSWLMSRLLLTTSGKRQHPGGCTERSHPHPSPVLLPRERENLVQTGLILDPAGFCRANSCPAARRDGENFDGENFVRLERSSTRPASGADSSSPDNPCPG